MFLGDDPRDMVERATRVLRTVDRWRMMTRSLVPEFGAGVRCRSSVPELNRS